MATAARDASNALPGGKPTVLHVAPGMLAGHHVDSQVQEEDHVSQNKKASPVNTTTNRRTFLKASAALGALIPAFGDPLNALGYGGSGAQSGHSRLTAQQGGP